MRPARGASAPVRSSSGAAIRPRRDFPRRGYRRCARHPHFPALPPAGQNLCYAWTLAPGLFLPGKVAPRQFAGEDDLARFISHNDDVTILALLLKGEVLERQRLLTEVWTRKSVAALLDEA